MKKFYCDVCDKPFTEGHKAGTAHPCYGVIGALIDGMDICDDCMTKLRSQIWEPKIWDMIRKEVRPNGKDK